MLYQILKNDTLFPGGFASQSIDMLVQNAEIRVMRAASEIPRMNHWEGNRIFFESDFHRQKRDKEQRLVDRQIEEETNRRDARGFSVNRFGINRPDKEIEYNSCAARYGVPVTTGKSSSYLNRDMYKMNLSFNHLKYVSRYLRTTPKVSTQYPRFHTGFTFRPVIGRN